MGQRSPAAGISQTNFTVRWTGAVQPLVSDTYTFYSTTDDGGRLWVNNQLIIDEWFDEAPTEHSGSITMVGQQRYNIRMDYYQDAGGAEASLSWGIACDHESHYPTNPIVYAHQSAAGGDSNRADERFYLHGERERDYDGECFLSV